jgi:hypothetical protein
MKLIDEGFYEEVLGVSSFFSSKPERFHRTLTEKNLDGNPSLFFGKLPRSIASC